MTLIREPYNTNVTSHWSKLLSSTDHPYEEMSNWNHYFFIKHLFLSFFVSTSRHILFDTVAIHTEYFSNSFIACFALKMIIKTRKCDDGYFHVSVNSKSPSSCYCYAVISRFVVSIHLKFRSVKSRLAAILWTHIFVAHCFIWPFIFFCLEKCSTNWQWNIPLIECFTFFLSTNVKLFPNNIGIYHIFRQ